MMIHFANPLWLWGFTGLLIPVGIHLLSRKEGKVIRFGSLRHLSESNTQQFRSLHLNEIFLLMMRCLLISLLILFLAGLQISGLSKEKTKWLLIEKELTKNPRANKLSDSLAIEGYEARYLAKSFPPVEDSIDNLSETSYWDLMEDLEDQDVDDVVVLSYNLVSRLKGKRMVLPENVRWVTFTPPEQEFTAQAVRQEKDSLWIRKGHTHHNYTAYTSEKVSTVEQDQIFESGNEYQITVSDSIRILILYTPDFEHDKDIVTAQLNAVQSATPHKMVINTTGFDSTFNDEKENDWIILLSGKNITLPDSINTLVYKYCDLENLPLIIPSSQLVNCSSPSPSKYLITKRLNIARAIEHKLGISLANLLLPDTLQHHIAPYDKRTFPDGLMWSSKEESLPTASLEGGVMITDEYLIVLFLLTFVAERVLSFKRNQ